MEWFNSIGNWFQENCGDYLMWLQTIDVAGVIAMFGLIIKQFFTTKDNTTNVKLLNTSLKDNKALQKKIERLEEKNIKLENEIGVLRKQNTDIIDGIDKILSKQNSMLDVYTLVYQTIKNEDTRIAVNNILMNARYNETATRQALTEKIEQLQENVKELTDNALAEVNDIVEQSKQILVVDDKSIPRG